MNIGNLPALLVSWLKTQGLGQLQAGRDSPPTSSFQPGAQYDAKVVQSLGSNRHMVLVGQQTLDMTLPRQAAVGESLRLTYLHSGPRPTFLLEQPAQAAQPVRLSDAAQQLSALLRVAQGGGNLATVNTPTLSPGSASSTGPVPSPSGMAQPGLPTSAAGQPGSMAPSPGSAAAALAQNPVATLLGGRPLIPDPAILLGGAPRTLPAVPGGAVPALNLTGQAVDAGRPSLATNTSLLAQGVASQTAATEQALPQRLHQVVSESGLFYESHLNKWNRGQLSLESVLREPQARLARMDVPTSPLPELRGMPEESARLAGRQLMMLEGGPFVWQGQAWPGQMLEWLVEERPGGEEGSEDGEMSRWRTQLRLTLPRLGEVTADLGIGAQGLRIGLTAADEAALADIKAALPDLVARLKDAGLKLTGLTTELAHGDAD